MRVCVPRARGREINFILDKVDHVGHHEHDQVENIISAPDVCNCKIENLNRYYYVNYGSDGDGAMDEVLPLSCPIMIDT